MVMVIILLALLIPLQVFGVIEQVTFLFAQGFCQDSCQTELKQKLAALPQVAGVTVGPASATIAWKPNTQFSYPPLKTAFQMVGVQRQNMRVIATGTVQKRGNAWYFTSTGDFTQFRLVGPLISSKSQYVIPYAIENHPIVNERKEFLEDAAKTKAVIRINGPLLEPETVSPTTLVMEDYRKA